LAYDAAFLPTSLVALEPRMTASPTKPAATTRIARIEVWPAPGELDPTGDTLLDEAKAAMGAGIEAVHVGRVYLIQSGLNEARLQRVADELLADPVNQQAVVGESASGAQQCVIEVHPKPGVMDPVALSTADAIAEMLPDVDRESLEVRTGFTYRFDIAPGQSAPEHAGLQRFAERRLANPVIEAIHETPHWPSEFIAGEAYELHVQRTEIRELDDEGLQRLSRDGHLFLSLEEMRAIRDYYRQARREPTDIELETLAQTWSEHCVHKTLTSTVHYTPAAPDDQHGEDNSLAIFRDKPGHELHPDGSVTIHNLLKRTVAAATHKLMEQAEYHDWCVSVFEDNAGIVKLDETHGVCIKVETHNHPSAIEPYGGAATGIGGCIRDIIGTGQAAKPIANTDVFCVAQPDHWREADEATTEDETRQPLPAGVLHPRRILQQVVAGVRDYGNRMGIPTVNGAVYFDDNFIGNPLVFAGCVGVMPLDRAFGEAKEGDRIIAIGGRTGRDGIHGATFSSAELTDSHAEEFSHAVQIGNPITEKKLLDVILRARDHSDGPLFNAITDCGAGGFSSAVGEMGEATGADVSLERAPLKYAGLSYTEIWISEAQERMVLSVPADRLAALQSLCEAEDVELCDLGRFGCRDDATDEPTLILRYGETEVGRLGMPFLHKGLPTPTRSATWRPGTSDPPKPSTHGARANIQSADKDGSSIEQTLLKLLSHPNIASKHWIIRQYDHEVQGASAVKPLTGPHQDGPSDGAVLRPKLDSSRGVALAGGMAPALSEQAAARGLSDGGDSYWAALAAIDEAVRNAVCVGADAKRIALLDNFCWPGCDDPEQLGALVRACEACYDGALAYHTPFVSGKDSLNNQFTTDAGEVIRIPQTLLITAMGLLDDVQRACTMDAKAAGDRLVIVGATTAAMGGSHYAMQCADEGPHFDRAIPRVDLQQGPVNAQAVSQLIQRGLVEAAHDCSDGGLLTAAAEMAFAGRVGLKLDLDAMPAAGELSDAARCFAETPSRYLLEVAEADWAELATTLSAQQVPFASIGHFNRTDRLTVSTADGHKLVDTDVDNLRATWLHPLDW
jgi:phosphoribosylformylglycinamidine synthase